MGQIGDPLFSGRRPEKVLSQIENEKEITFCNSRYDVKLVIFEQNMKSNNVTKQTIMNQ